MLSKVEPMESSDLNLGMSETMQYETRQQVLPEDEAPEDQEGCCKRLITMQFVFVLLCLVCIVASSALTSLLKDYACDDALEDTEASGQKALAITTRTGAAALENVTDNLLSLSLEGVKGMLDAYLKQGETRTELMATALLGHFAKHNKSDPGFIWELASPLWHLNKEELEGRKTVTDQRFAALGVVVGHRGISMGITGTFVGNPHISTVINDGSNPQLGYYGYSTDVTGLLVPGDPVTPIVYGPMVMPEILLAKQLLRPGDLRWMGEQSIAGEFVGYPIIKRLEDPANSVSELQVISYFGLAGVREFLLKSVEEMNVPSRYHPPVTSVDRVTNVTTVRNDSAFRIYTCTASSWIAQTLRGAGVPNWEEQDTAYTLTGVSSGELLTLQPAFDPYTMRVKLSPGPTKDINATDFLISAVAREIQSRGNGSVDGYAAAEGQSTITVDGHEYFATVTRYNNGKGVDWWIVVTLETDVVLHEVKTTRARIMATQARERADLNDRVERQRWYSRGYITIVAAVLLGISICITNAALRPIQEVQHEMSEVAHMKLDRNAVAPTSAFAEVRQMQRDFLSMVASLKEFRAYLPDSLLTEEEAAGRVAPPKGNVAIVFTDIQSSTALWRQSAVDMNCALELHNEIIREQCLVYGGYEVKTIGDAFMVAFQEVERAAKFAVSVQQALADATWPDGLILPRAGLVIRIGINHGVVIAEENPITGRVDYRGTPVNMAARVEAAAMGGTVCVPQATFELLKPRLAEVGHPATASHGKHELKGLGGAHELFLLAPTGCAIRFTSDSDCKKPDETLVLALPPRPPGVGSSGGSPAKRPTARHHPSALSSRSPSNLASEMEMRRNKVAARGKTDVGLDHAMMTVAVVDILPNHEQQLRDTVTTVLSTVLSRVAETDGTMAYVAGERMCVAWNTTKPLANHAVAGMRFASVLGMRLQSSLSLGIACGGGLFGNIGTARTRYATTLGAPLRVAEALAGLSRTLGTFCLYGDVASAMSTDAMAIAQCSFRLIDAWLEPADRITVRVYDVHLGDLMSRLENWGLSSPTSSPGVDSAGIVSKKNTARTFTELVEAALSGAQRGENVAESLMLVVGGKSAAAFDPVCMYVVKWLCSGQPMAVSGRCTVEFSSAPTFAPLLEAPGTPTPRGPDVLAMSGICMTEGGLTPPLTSPLSPKSGGRSPRSLSCGPHPSMQP